MDTFMDKLAQRFTAQEMIKANTAADAEEMKQLKERVQEYSDCLNRMQEVCKQLERAANDAQAKIDAAGVDGEDIDRVVEAGLTKIRQIQQDTEALNALKSQMQQDAEALDGLKRQMEEMRAVQCTADDMANVNRGVQELQQKLRDMDQKSADDDSLDEKLESVTENVHRECVKVYRNVQAVITEENTKRADDLNDAMKAVTGKMKLIFGISVAALVFSVAGVLVQVLTCLNII